MAREGKGSLPHGPMNQLRNEAFVLDLQGLEA